MMEKHKWIAGRDAAAVALLLVTASCREGDQVRLATCDTGQMAQLTFIVPPPGHGQQVLLNGQQLTLGTVLQLDSTPNAAVSVTGRAVHVLASMPDSLESDRIESLAATLPGSTFTFQAPKGVAAPARPERVLIYFEELRRTSLREPIASLNRDEQAIQLLREGAPHSRFAIVSAVWFGGTIDVWNSVAPFVGVNAAKQGSSYVHTTFVCPPLTETDRNDVSSLGSERPVLFAYTRVRYEPRIKTIVEGDEPFDLSQ